MFMSVKHCTYNQIREWILLNAKLVTLSFPLTLAYTVYMHACMFLMVSPQATNLAYTFNEIVSTRRLGSRATGKHFVDLKLGNLMVQRVTRCETQQVTLSCYTYLIGCVCLCVSVCVPVCRLYYCFDGLNSASWVSRFRWCCMIYFVVYILLIFFFFFLACVCFKPPFCI